MTVYFSGGPIYLPNSSSWRGHWGDEGGGKGSVHLQGEGGAVHGLQRAHAVQERCEGKLDLSGGKPDNATVEEREELAKCAIFSNI